MCETSELSQFGSFTQLHGSYRIQVIPNIHDDMLPLFQNNHYQHQQPTNNKPPSKPPHWNATSLKTNTAQPINEHLYWNNIKFIIITQSHWGGYQDNLRVRGWAHLEGCSRLDQMKSWNSPGNLTGWRRLIAFLLEKNTVITGLINALNISNDFQFVAFKTAKRQFSIPLTCFFKR